MKISIPLMLLILLVLESCVFHGTHRSNCVSKAFQNATAWRINTGETVLISEQKWHGRNHWQAKTLSGTYLCGNGWQVTVCENEGKEYNSLRLDDAMEKFLTFRVPYGEE